MNVMSLLLRINKTFSIAQEFTFLEEKFNYYQIYRVFLKHVQKAV
jgi:hypothetical protein